MHEKHTTYESFIESAREYRKTFEYCFDPKSLNSITNKWILLTLTHVAVGISIYIYSIDAKNIVDSNFAGVILGIALIFLGGYFRSKFDKEIYTQRLIERKIIKPEESKLKKWQLRSIYLKTVCAPLFSDIKKAISEVDEVESKIKSNQEILDKIIGFTWIDNLLSIKASGNTIIYTIGIAALGAVGGMYLNPLKEQLTTFYETPISYLAFCLLILGLLLTGLFAIGMTLGVIGIFVVRHLDLNDRHLSRYARSKYKRDLLMLAIVDTKKNPEKSKIAKPGNRYKFHR